MLNDKTVTDKTEDEKNIGEKAAAQEVKLCTRCGRTLPISSFFTRKYESGKVVPRSECKECTNAINKKNKIKKRNEKLYGVSPKPDIPAPKYERQYKTINSKRELDLSKTGLDITLLGTDETFIKQNDYQDIWLSNYGRVIQLENEQYQLVQGQYDENTKRLYYMLKKNVFRRNKWIFEEEKVYADVAVVKAFVVNTDWHNNIYIWHCDNAIEDNYYRNLYPLNQKEYEAVQKVFDFTGKVSEKDIANITENKKYKPNGWEAENFIPTVCSVGYIGCSDERGKSNTTVYKKWRAMLNRCYNEKIQNRQKTYKCCTVCEEWKNFSNFKEWYESHNCGDSSLNLDKDILVKGNKEYGPDNCCIVPEFINTLFTNGKANRGKYPLGVHAEKSNACGIVYYRAAFMANQRNIKLGTFKTPEEAFQKYKEYKEQYIKDTAKRYKDKIPYSVYEAMMNWKIEITD